MSRFIESAAIALSAIWSNKLRSMLTVLGNIVAVTSIIAVVSLVRNDATDRAPIPADAALIGTEEM